MIIYFTSEQNKSKKALKKEAKGAAKAAKKEERKAANPVRFNFKLNVLYMMLLVFLCKSKFLFIFPL